MSGHGDICKPPAKRSKAKRRYRATPRVRRGCVQKQVPEQTERDMGYMYSASSEAESDDGDERKANQQQQLKLLKSVAKCQPFKRMKFGENVERVLVQILREQEAVRTQRDFVQLHEMVDGYIEQARRNGETVIHVEMMLRKAAIPPRDSNENEIEDALKLCDKARQIISSELKTDEFAPQLQFFANYTSRVLLAMIKRYEDSSRVLEEREFIAQQIGTDMELATAYYNRGSFSGQRIQYEPFIRPAIRETLRDQGLTAYEQCCDVIRSFKMATSDELSDTYVELSVLEKKTLIKMISLSLDVFVDEENLQRQHFLSVLVEVGSSQNHRVPGPSRIRGRLSKPPASF